MTRLTPSPSLCSYVRFKWGPLHLLIWRLCIGTGYHTKRNHQGTGPLMSHGHPAPPDRSDLPARRHLKAAVRNGQLTVNSRHAEATVAERPRVGIDCAEALASRCTFPIASTAKVPRVAPVGYG
jgi:hypothetical protein